MTTLAIAIVLSALSAPVGTVISQKWLAGTGIGYDYSEIILEDRGKKLRYVAHYGAVWQASETGEWQLPASLHGVFEQRDIVTGKRTELPAPWWARYAEIHENDAGLVRASGWPVPVAYSRSFRRDESGQHTLPHQGLIIIGKTNPLFIDFLPLWPGLLGNTAIYAAVIAVPWITLRWQRLNRRRKRNQCLACGYELGTGVERCPECGLNPKPA